MHGLFVCAERYPGADRRTGDLVGALNETLRLVRWMHAKCAAVANDITVVASVCDQSAAVVAELRPLVSLRSVFAGPGHTPAELTAAHVKHAIRDAPNGWQDHDRFLLHWAGHGTRYGEGQLLELPAYHEDGDAEPTRAVVRVEDVLRRFAAVHRRIDQILIFEACANIVGEPVGELVDVTGVGPLAKSAKVNQGAAFAADIGQFAMRSGGVSVFTGLLIEHLADRDASVLLPEEFDDVVARMRSELCGRIARNARGIVQLPIFRSPHTTAWSRPTRNPYDQFGLYGERVVALLAQLDLDPTRRGALKSYLYQHGVPSDLLAQDDPIAWGRSLTSWMALPDGDHALRHLLQWLYVRCDQPQAREWAQALHQRGDLAAFRPEEVESRQPVVLVMGIGEDDHSPDTDDESVRYQATLRLYLGGDPYRPSRDGPDGSQLPRTGLNDHLADFYLRARDTFDTIDGAHIQVVAPAELFNHPFEQARVEAEGEFLVLGDEHPVMLRYDRRHGVRKPLHHGKWQRSAGMSHDIAEERLNRHRCGIGPEVREGPVAGFVQDYPWTPGEGTVEAALVRGEWAIAWTAGTGCTGECPASGDVCAGAELGARLTHMLRKHGLPLDRLPYVVQELRNTLNEASGAGQRMVLVFDNPQWRPWGGQGLLRAAPRQRETHDG
nr:caspase family protein [Streptomyces sp. SID3343]